MLKSSLFVSLLSFSVVAACSGGDSDNEGGGGGGDLADAGAGGGGGGGGGGGDTPDADTGGGGGEVACTPVSDFADLGAIDGEVIGDGVDYISIDSTLDEASVDLFVVELFADFAPFADGLVEGTFEITGDQTDYNTCGACAVVYSDLEEGGMLYTAQSGTIVVTSIEGNFTGTFTPSAGTTSFVGYSANEDTGEYDRRDDCTVNGGGATWDKAIPTGEAPMQ